MNLIEPGTLQPAQSGLPLSVEPGNDIDWLPTDSGAHPGELGNAGVAACVRQLYDVPRYKMW